eukprot:m.63713 g.63713  ORF g.63713 m.63713 type:complete len:271 (+) comp11597_c0_seq2:87-899(+)
MAQTKTYILMIAIAIVSTAASSPLQLAPAPSPAPLLCGCDQCANGSVLPPKDARIRVAAIGDSITRGHPLKGDNLQFNYPCTLERLLGPSKYVVFNFGAGGNTLSHPSPPELNASKSFWNSSQFALAKQSSPDVVLIMLGTNDAVATIWDKVGDEYTSAYADLLNVFKSMTPVPSIYAMTSPPLYNGHFAGINQTVVNHVLPGKVAEVVTANKLPPAVPVFDGMGGVNLTHHEWFFGNGSYGCHPNMAGYSALAHIVYNNTKFPSHPIDN